MPAGSDLPAGPALKGLRAIAGHALERNAESIGAAPLVVAVSGGADSTALLLALASLPPAKRPALIPAHFSHGLRPSADVREARLVRRLCSRLGLPLEAGAGASGASESDARGARYGFLTEVALAHGAAAVATAHTQDDQAETVLLRLTRGAGLRGAGAMRELSARPVGNAMLTLFRPILGASRELTLAVCAEASVKPASDGSNRSLRYARNRVRRRVLPELTQVNPTVREALARFAWGAQADDDLLQRIADEAAAPGMETAPGSVEWDRKTLGALPEPLLIRALSAGWTHVAGEGTALPERVLRNAVTLIRPGAPGELMLGHGVRLTVGRERVRLATAP